MTEETQLPDAPTFSEEQIKRCWESGDFMPVLFEWYKYVGHLCIFVAITGLHVIGARGLPLVQCSVLAGLLNRCSRLMLANLALSSTGRFGETTALLDRCIFETCVKVMWLCRKRNDDAFKAYLSDGLKPEVELSSEIRGLVSRRGDGQSLVIERRMLESINRCMTLSGLTEAEILEAKRLPNIAAMIADLGHPRLMYVALQRMGSHHIHGTWSSLLTHYLEEENGSLLLRDHDCETHPSQFVIISLFVLSAVASYVDYVLAPALDIGPLLLAINSAEQEIRRVFSFTANGDFDIEQ